jgi:hypothetical protein
VKGVYFLGKASLALAILPVSGGVSAPRKAWRIWSGESPGMERVNRPPLPSVAPLAERCLGHEDWSIREQEG